MKIKVITSYKPGCWEQYAKKGIEAGVKEVFFDRGCYKYHGRVKALADNAREAGLKF